MKKIFLISLLIILALSACSPAAPTADQANEAQPTPVNSEPVEATEEEAAPVATESSEIPDPETEIETSLSRAITSEPQSLDPHGAISAGQNVILPYLLDTLVFRDANNQYHPYLAESWQVLDGGKTYEFKLKDDVKFHDGTPFNAEAVRFNFQRMKDATGISPLAGSFAVIGNMVIVDDLTIRFELRAPSAVFLSTLSTPYAGFVSPAAVEQYGEDFGQHLVGTGAYKLENWEPGLAITLVKNEDYAWPPNVVENQGAPHIDRLVFKVIPDATMQMNAFQSGDVDIFFVNQPSQIEAMANVPDADVVTMTLNSMIYIGFNVQKPPFDSVPLRRAIAYAMDKDALVEIALGGIGAPAYTPLTPTLPGYAEDLVAQDPHYDLAAAKAALEEAGYVQQADNSWTKDGENLTVELLISTRAPNDALATVVQAQLAEIGIPVQIRSLDSGAARTAMDEGDYQVSIWRYDWNDPDVLNMYLASDRIGRTNRNFYSNPQVDELLAKAAVTMDDAQRMAIYHDAQEIIIAEQPWIPLYIAEDYMVIRTNVKDYLIGAMGRMILNDAWIEQ